MSETHKIFAWQEGKFWRGQQLLPMSQIRNLLATLKWQYPVFATIQNYDEEGRCLSSPIYFDLDGSPDVVLADARHLVNALQFLLDVTPKIFFSGNRGFHFVIDYMIEHSSCHLLVQDFAREIAGGMKTMDMSVYRQQSMFRIPGSLGSARDAYKIEITKDELTTLSFAEIKALAKNQRMIDSGHDADSINTAAMKDWINIAINKLPNYTRVEEIIAAGNASEMDFTPCLQTLMFEGGPKGRRNEAACLLARYFKLAGIDEDAAVTAILAQEPWAKFERQGREVTKVFKSVFRSGRPPQIGCKGPSQSADLMRSVCSQTCWVREDSPIIKPVDDRKLA